MVLEGEVLPTQAPDPTFPRQELATRFWPKLKRLAARLPFAVDLLAAYYCARDPATPLRVRAALTAALFYFILPTDAVPDFLALVGFGDDGAVLASVLALVSAHVRPRHHQRARRALVRASSPS